MSPGAVRPPPPLVTPLFIDTMVVKFNMSELLYFLTPSALVLLSENKRDQIENLKLCAE